MEEKLHGKSDQPIGGLQISRHYRVRARCECGVIVSPRARLKSNSFCTGSKAYRRGRLWCANRQLTDHACEKSSDAANAAAFGHSPAGADESAARRWRYRAQLWLHGARPGNATL